MPKKNPLRVGIVFDDTLDSNDGVAQYVKGLGRWLGAQGHHVVYLVGETKTETWAGGKVYSLSKNIQVSFNGNKMTIPLPANKRKIKDVLSQENLDVIHVQMPYSPFLAQKIINQSANSAIIGTFHVFPVGFIARRGAKLLHLLQSFSLKKFDQVLAVSKPAADFAQNDFGLQTKASSNLVDVAKFQAAGQSPIKNHIVFLGRLVARKGCKQLIEAFYLLQQKMPDATLTIAGDGADRFALEALVKSKALSDKVKFLGFIDEKDKPKLLSTAAIACFPSLGGESFGIVLIEAMAAGAGVVLGGDNPGYRSVLGEQEMLLINPKNKAAFAKRLEELLSDQSLAQSLHAWQNERVKIYDVNNVGRQVLSVYHKEIDKKRSKGNN